MNTLLFPKAVIRIGWLLLGGCIFILCNSFCAHAQLTLSIHSSNDFLNITGNGTDRYFTAGTSLQFTRLHQRKQSRNPFVVKMSDSEYLLSSISIVQQLHTPSDIAPLEPIVKDYPYSGSLGIEYSQTQFVPARNYSFTTQIHVGVLGKYAFGEEVQTWVHKLIKYQVPNGWDNQLPTDFLLNYNLLLEKNIMRSSSRMDLTGFAHYRIGTMFNDVSIGSMIRFGNLTSWFQPESRIPVRERPNQQFYLFFQPSVSVVLSNALLEGGTFNKNKLNRNPTRVASDDLTRLNYAYTFGFTWQTKGFQIQLSQSLKSRQTVNTYSHEYGSITIKTVL